MVQAIRTFAKRARYVAEEMSLGERGIFRMPKGTKTGSPRSPPSRGASEDHEKMWGTGVGWVIKFILMGGSNSSLQVLGEDAPTLRAAEVSSEK
jgi:hypothetical protein